MTISALYELAESKGYEVINTDLPKTESLSMMDTTTGNCYIGIDYGRITSSKDEKTKLSHELGHCEKGAFYNRYSKLDIISRHEYRADKWAIEHTMPKDEVIAALRCGISTVWELSELFGVSERFVRLMFYIYFDKEVTPDERQPIRL